MSHKLDCPHCDFTGYVNSDECGNCGAPVPWLTLA
jgi:hypothetical protein